MAYAKRAMQSWGRVRQPVVPMAAPAFPAEAIAAFDGRGDLPVLAYGLGRSYGDSNLNSTGAMIDMGGLRRLIAFDRETGLLRADAGLSLTDILRVVVPHGWFLATTPGTRFVTLGGAIANDVHGKNHHQQGSFGCSLRRIGLLRSDEGLVELDATDKSGLWAATIGGLGLTGLILWAEIQLVRVPSSMIAVEKVPFGSVAEFFGLVTQSQGFEHTVAWVDCASSGAALGRGILQRGNWAAAGGYAPHSVRGGFSLPVDLPSFALNRWSIGAFNALYYRAQQWKPQLRQPYQAFFYPLDAIGHWNRLYGRRGFYQYQCVVPPESSEAAIAELLRQIAASGAGSFLAVLKTFGPKRSAGLLSFPREGATLALDFANKGDATLRLLERLDEVVREARGALYPAKDGRMPADMFRLSFPHLDEFMPHVDPAMRSDFWQRVSA